MNTNAINTDYLRKIGMDGDYKQVYLDCEVCGRDSFEPLMNKGKVGQPGQYGPISIVQCGHCGHVMVNPRFESRFYVDFYRDFYKENVVALGDGAPTEKQIERQRVRGQNCCDYIMSAHNVKAGRMLDLGCAYGATMVPFRDRGWKVSGIDPEQASVDFGRDVLGVPVDYGFGENLPYQDNSFDLAISLGALEHVHDFGASMSELNRVLKPGGLLFIRMRHNRPWGVIWEYYNRNHYRFFCGPTHRLAVLRYGFETVEYTDTQIEGRSGDRYLICQNTGEPGLEAVEQAIALGVKDTPAELKAYLHNHLETSVTRAQELLNLKKKCGGDKSKIVDEIKSGRFEYTLLWAYMDPDEAVSRALLEATRLIEESRDHGIAD